MPRRVCRQPAVVALMFLFATLSVYQMRLANQRIPISKGLDISRLPKEYATSTMETEFCENRFGSDYLHAFQTTSQSHCDVKSPSQLTCFNNTVNPDGRKDTFCVGGPSLYLPMANEFSLTCHPPGTSQDRPASPFNPSTIFSDYWYETGPKQVFSHFIQVIPEGPGLVQTIDPTASTAVLVKRENVSHNTWHSLMEIMSTYFSLDILRMTMNPTTGTHYFTSSDFDNTQVIILDTHSEGPYFDLWHLFARKPVVRLSNLTTTTVFENIIVPLPGGSNPFWQGDWTSLPDCKNSTLLRAFSSRVLYAYNIATSSTRLSSSSTSPLSLSNKKQPINLTILNRTATRQLLNQSPLLTALRTLYPTTLLQITSLDYATIPFETQLTQTHDNTDILVGVHGAGLTHAMFLRPGSTLIEFQPWNLDGHVGFRNLAKMMEGVDYVTAKTSRRSHSNGEPEQKSHDNKHEEVTHTKPTSTSKPGYEEETSKSDDTADEDVDREKRATSTTKTPGKEDWHHADVWIDEEVFLRVIGGVIDETGKRRGLL